MDQHERLLAGCRIIPDTVDELSYLKHIARYEFAAAYVKGRRVLDIGCGTGYGSHFLACSGARSVIGLDVSTEAVGYAREHFHADNLCFRTGDAQHIDIASASVDVVISFEAIEHLVEPERLLDEAGRTLCADGLLVVSTPNRRFCSPFGALHRTVNPFHAQEWLPDEFYELLGTRFGQLTRFGQVHVDHPRQQVLGTWFRHRMHRWLIKPAYRALHETRFERTAKQVYRTVCGPDKDRHGDVPMAASRSAPSLEEARTEHFRVREMDADQDYLVLLAVCSQPVRP